MNAFLRTSLCCLLLTLPAGASALEFGLRGGTSYPIGDARYTQMSGSLGALLRFGKGPLVPGLVLEAGEENYGRSSDVGRKTLVRPALLGDLQWRLAEGWLQPYASGTAGMALVDRTQSYSDVSEKEAGMAVLLQTAVGLRFAAGTLGIEADVGPRLFLGAGPPSLALRLGFTVAP